MILGRRRDRARLRRRRIRREAEDLQRPTDFGPAEIRRLRDRQGFGLSAFARALGVSPVSVWQWERGLARPSGPARQILHYLELGVLLLDPESFAKKPGRPKKGDVKAGR